MTPKDREEKILQFWAGNKIFEKSLEKPAPRGDFVFYEGPPTANGLPGIHHLESRAFKDVIPRYKTMQGYRVARRAGWDTHGLPVEIEVEKELGLKSKREIEKYGIAEFNRKCRESVFKYVSEWQKFTNRIAFWLDQANAYITYQPDYMEKLWGIIKKVWERGLLYKDYKVLPWCPRCGTALSSHELALGYKNVDDPAVYVKFKIKNKKNEYLVAWTTTPWTLPGNVALAVGSDIKYKKVKVGDEIHITHDSEGDIAGRDLVGLEYEALYPFIGEHPNAYKVYSADFVTTKEGTGIVHTAVMYGTDDFELGARVGLPKKHLINEAGQFLPGTGFLEGKFVKDADSDIISDLEKRGLLVKQETVTHTYPFCWRCGSPLIYFARDSWYIKMSQLREELIKENEKINWVPGHIKDGRFGEWLREVKDWAVSRERYWGTPLPVWECGVCKEQKVIGSLDELKQNVKKSGNKYWVMRHGEAESNIKNIVWNKLDGNPLTDYGRLQVEEAAGKLKGFGIDVIISSDLLRGRQTSEIIARALGLDVEYNPRLREINTGDLNGHSVEEYWNYAASIRERFTKRLPNGENYTDVKKRAGDLIYGLDKKYSDKKILIITHDSPAWLMFAASSGHTADEITFINEKLFGFMDNAEVRPLEFIPFPHNEDYEMDLHRPYIDEVSLVCKCAGEMKRVKELMDVWFDSGAMPFATGEYPERYPADYIAEAIDQTGGWFYTL